MKFKNVIRESGNDRIIVNCEVQYDKVKSIIKIKMRAGSITLDDCIGKSTKIVAKQMYASVKKYVTKTLGGKFKSDEDSFYRNISGFLKDFSNKYKNKGRKITVKFNDFFFHLYDGHNNGQYYIPFSTYKAKLPDTLPVDDEDEIEGRKGVVGMINRGISNFADEFDSQAGWNKRKVK